jgi:predicted AlkP superfamily pyrophosphatase or phosphodiesterase
VVGRVMPGMLGEGNAKPALSSRVLEGPGIELLAKACVLILTLPEKRSVAITAIAPIEMLFLHSSSDIAAKSDIKRNSYRASSLLICLIKTVRPCKLLDLTNHSYTMSDYSIYQLHCLGLYLFYEP